ncbi:single-stranded DNA-binding protein [bacterium]|nr:single-stranded DNA-binding protein [bacterium]
MSYTPSGVAVTKVSLATTKKWTSASGEKREQTEWHNLVFWRKSAEIANEYLRKGSRIYVDGEINYRSWEGQDGQKRYATDIVVNNFQMLSSRSEGGGGGQGGGGQQRQQGGGGGQGGGQGGARQRSKQQQQPQDGPYYEPIDPGDQGGGGQSGGGQDQNFGGNDDDDLPF